MEISGHLQDDVKIPEMLTHIQELTGCYLYWYARFVTLIK